MWDPDGWPAQTSYRQPVADPGTAPGDVSLITLTCNTAWLPYLVGSLMQLAQIRTWTITDPTALADLLGRVTDLLGIVATAADATNTLAPVSNGNPAAPLVSNGAGAIVLN